MGLTDEQVFDDLDDIDVALGKEELYFCGVDVETTGLEYESAEIIELGYSIWDMRAKKPVFMRSDLILHEDLEVPIEIEKITGITTKDLKGWGIPPSFAYTEFLRYAQDCDFLVAHNAPFDRGFLSHHLKDFAYEDTLGNKPWIDTVVDVPWETNGSRSLSYLACDYGFLNPFSHRALFDVQTMMKLLCKHDVDEIIRRLQIPTYKVLADVSFSDKELAKDRGFKWNPIDKNWWIYMKKDVYEKQIFPFKVITTVVDK